MTPSPFTAVISAAVTAPPMGFPKITIGGVPKELRYTFYSSFFLENSANIPIHELNQWMAGQYEAKKISVMLMTMTGAMLGNEVNGKWVHTPMTAEEISKAVTMEEWSGLMKHYTEAILKVSDQLTAAVEAAKAAAQPAGPEQVAEPTEPIVVN